MEFSLFDKKNLNGFTLIELLLVIAIIGVLSSFLIANFIGAKARARDAQRKSDVRQIQAAVELYRADQDTYPTDAEMSTCKAQLTKNGTIYMKSIPCDPLSNTAYTYSTDATQTTYTLTACLENKNDKEGISVASCGTGWGYQVTNP
jgi:general secretion pathway protein G